MVFANNANGIDLESDSNGNNITDNTVFSNNENGIYLWKSIGNNFLGNNISLNKNNGMYLRYSGGSSIIGNRVSSNSIYGMYIYESDGNNISDNKVLDNIEGIYIYGSANNYIVDNNASNNKNGIYIFTRDKNFVADNKLFRNHQSGIQIRYSEGIEITNNEMIGNGIYLLGSSIEQWNTHDIDILNTVNGKPVYYWKNQIGGTVPLGAGQVILANSTSIKIYSQEFTNCSVGIELGYSMNNDLQKNNASNNSFGFYLYQSFENIIAGNNASHNDYGLYLESSDNNDIEGNIIMLNGETGIYLDSSSGNVLYHNNIIDNEIQAFDDTDNGNQWDNGYFFGGNFWSDYNGVDDYKGPSQDQPGSDGIGDTHYLIDSDSEDNYPLIKFWVPDNSPPVIELISPLNNSIIKSGIIINLTISDRYLDIVTYSINGGGDQTLISPYDIETNEWDDGNCLVEINAVDYYSNENTTWFEFNIDSLFPSIELNSPTNNSYITSDIEIDLTITDVNLNQVIYSKNGGTATPLSEPYNIDTSGWIDGEYTITVYANDSAGNYNEKWYDFIKDSVNPQIMLNLPDNDTLLLEPSTLDFDISDENLKSASYSINQEAFMILEEPYEIDTTFWGDGDYIVTIKAEDECR